MALARWTSGVAFSAVNAPERPTGKLIWVIPDETPETFGGVLMVLRRLVRLCPDLTLLVSASDALAPLLPPDAIRTERPSENPPQIEAMLRHWRPDAIVVTGTELPVVLTSIAYDAGVPVISMDAHLPNHATPPGFLRRRLLRAALSRMTRISVRDAGTMSALISLGTDPAAIEVGGSLAEPPEPLHCSEAERASIATVTRTRPVWFAASVPMGEFAFVTEAHARAQRHAHRMLLILAPERCADSDLMAADLTAKGWIVGRRTVEGEPDEDTQIFMADEPGEFGLWYRIAPVTWMGGTFAGTSEGQDSPLDAAALGSAIIHGPHTGSFAHDYARLDEARAARMVLDETSLGDVVADLMASDKAAMLAHNAWAVTSGGAGAAEAVARMIVASLPPALLLGEEP